MEAWERNTLEVGPKTEADGEDGASPEGKKLTNYTKEIRKWTPRVEAGERRRQKYIPVRLNHVTYP